MRELADRLTLELDRVMKAETGLTAQYDFTPTFSPDTAPADVAPFPGLFAAIQAQIGLKLEPKKGPAGVVGQLPDGPTGRRVCTPRRRCETIRA